MATKKFIVYYNEKENIIGYREHHFEWEEGDVIVTNGMQTAIFAIFDGTEKNLRVASNMISVLKRYTPKYKRVSVPNGDIKLSGDFVDDVINIWMNSHEKTVLANKRVWKNFDAMLDYVEYVVNEVMD